MAKKITVIWYGTTPQNYDNVEDFRRFDDKNIEFKSVKKDGGRTVTTYVKTNFPYFFEEVIEHSGSITI